MTENIIALLIPFGAGVILPIVSVWLTFRSIMNRDNHRAEILAEAIKCNPDVDASSIADAFSKKPRTPREVLNLRLLRGCMFTLGGIALAVVCAILCENTDLTVMDFPGFFLLISGASSLAVGISYLVVYFVTRNQIED